MSQKIDGKTQKQAVHDLDSVLDDTYQGLCDQGVPYPATVADAMRVAAVAAIEQAYQSAALKAVN